MGSNNFPIWIQGNVTGSGDMEKAANAMERLAGAIETGGKKAESANPSFDKFAATVRNAIQNPLQTAGGAVEGFLKALGPVGVVSAGAAAGIAVVAKQAFDLVRSYGEAAEETQNFALKTGLSVKQTLQWSAAAKIAHVDIGSLQAGMRILSQNFEEGNSELTKGQRLLRAWGIEARDGAGNLRPMGELIPQIAEAIASLPDIAAKQRALKDLFGRGGSELLPLFQDMPTLLKRVGNGFNEDLTKRLAEVNEKIELAEIKWNSFKKSIAGKVAIVVDLVLPDSLEDQRKRAQRSDAELRSRNYWATGEQGSPYHSATRIGSGQSIFEIVRPKLGPGAMSGTASGLFARDAQAWKSPEQRYAEWQRYEGSQTELAIKKQLNEAELDLASAAEKHDVVAHKAARRRIDSLKEELELFEKGKKLGAFEYKEGSNVIPMRSVPSLFGPAGVGKRWSTGPLVINSADTAAANQGRDQAAAETNRAYLEGMYNRQKASEDLAKSALDHQVRMVQLLAGPGGEVAAIERATALRIQGAKTELEVQRAINEKEEQLAQLSKQRVESYVSAVQSGFDALISGGRGGFGSFFKSQGLGIERQIVGNVARMTYNSVSSFVPHAAEDSFMGKLLQGTPFGPDPLKTAGVTLNTAGVKLDLAAQHLMAVSAMGGGLGVGDAVSRNLGLFAPPGVNTSIYDLPLSNPSGKWLGMFGPEGTPIPAAKGSGWFARNATTLGIGTAALGGGLGIYSGVRQGGAEGALTASGSGLAAAGAIMSLASKSLSWAGPVGMLAGMGLGMITSLFGDPKKRRQEQLQAEADRRAFTDPTGADYSYDLYGRAMDRDYRGRSRTVVVYQTNHISALDAASFSGYLKARPAELAEGITHAITSGNADDVIGSLRQAAA